MCESTRQAKNSIEDAQSRWGNLKQDDPYRLILNDVIQDQAH